MPMPRCGLEKSLSERHGRGMARARHGLGMACVNQMGETQSKLLAVRHGRGTAWERYGMCELALNPLFYRVPEHGSYHVTSMLMQTFKVIGTDFFLDTKKETSVSNCSSSILVLTTCPLVLSCRSILLPNVYIWPIRIWVMARETAVICTLMSWPQRLRGTIDKPAHTDIRMSPAIIIRVSQRNVKAWL
jgi:hypothetical protein